MKRPALCNLLSVVLLAAVVLTGCATSPAVKTMQAEQPRQEPFRAELKRELSSINLAIETSEQELADTLSRLAPRELYRGATTISGVTVVVLREGAIQVQAVDHFVHLAVPVAVTLHYGLFETLPLRTKLKFKLTARMTPDWRLQPELYYTGLSEQLVEEIGIGPLSIKPRSIVEATTQPVQRVVSDLVARKLNEKFPLRTEAAKVWHAVQKPILLDKQYRAWLVLQPQEALVYPLYAQHRQIRLGVGLKSFAELVVGPEPASRPAIPLPSLKTAAGQDRSFRVALHTDLHYRDLLSIVAPLLIGKEFVSDGRRVVLKEIDLYGNGDRLVIRLATTGSLEGVLYLTCKPVFNPQTNRFSVEEVDFDLQSESMLLRTAEWFLHGTIREAIQEKLNMDLSQRLTQVRDMAGKALGRVRLAETIYLTGSVKTVRLADVLVRQESLSIQVYTEGESSVVLR